jgi:hypothetical protein
LAIIPPSCRETGVFPKITLISRKRLAFAQDGERPGQIRGGIILLRHAESAQWQDGSE